MFRSGALIVFVFGGWSLLTSPGDPGPFTTGMVGIGALFALTGLLTKEEPVDDEDGEES